MEILVQTIFRIPIFEFRSYAQEQFQMNSLIAQIRRMYAWAIRAANVLQSPFLLFVRLYWGWQLIQSGWGKLHNLQKVTEFFTSLDLPMPAQMAFFISCVEFFGGLLLVLGLLSRLNALVLTVNMITAYVTADREALLSFFSDPDKFSAAAPYVLHRNKRFGEQEKPMNSPNRLVYALFVLTTALRSCGGAGWVWVAAEEQGVE